MILWPQSAMCVCVCEDIGDGRARSTCSECANDGASALLFLNKKAGSSRQPIASFFRCRQTTPTKQNLSTATGFPFCLFLAFPSKNWDDEFINKWMGKRKNKRMSAVCLVRLFNSFLLSEAFQQVEKFK